ncbi:hypothetical protein [Candidatus Vesicomyidisocius calyptogenae]|uniref:hypothetical protein n=1 Tax=Vesicomyosocius okutanii subsp. Calyptogena okutanii (strain HA) TaxID=412965 RepID=UPI0002FBCF30|nr:hypothetical protein [Candidatus Vesicomyosocius okutanii]
MPIIESAYYPFSYLHGMVSGLLQFILLTEKLYSLENNLWYDDRRDILVLTKAAD